MTRQVLLLGGFGVALLAGAAGPVRAQVIYCPPIPYCPPPVIVLPYCPPAYPILPPQQAYPPPKVQESTSPESPKAGLAKPESAKPDAAPSPRTAEPKRNLDGPGAADPVKPAAFDVPKQTKPAEDKPLFDPARIPIVPPRSADPDSIAPPMIPVPNVPSKPEPDSINPPMIPVLPVPEKLKEDKPKEEKPTIPPLRGVPDPTLPGLTLPVPGVDAGKSTSKASPLTASPRPLVDVFPVAGAAPAGPDARRRVGFFNHTDRDLRLTVEGQTITLPRRHHVTASVPPRFAWKLEDGAEQKAEVPAAAPGLDVVIRR